MKRWIIHGRLLSGEPWVASTAKTVWPKHASEYVLVGSFRAVHGPQRFWPDRLCCAFMFGFIR